MYATVYIKRKKLRGIQYTRDEAALFCIKNASDDLMESRTQAIKLIEAYCKRWGNKWTHYALWRGNTFNSSKQLTPVIPLPKS